VICFRDLTDLDFMSISDPMCVLFEKRDGKWVEIGRTEVILNNLNPDWEKKFDVDYTPGKEQQLKFEVWDSDSSSKKLKKHDFLGRLETNLETLLAAPNNQYVSVMKTGPSKKGKFIIVSEEVNSNLRDRMMLQLNAKNLDKKDTFGKSDPYFILSKYAGAGTLVTVVRSDHVMNTTKPEWRSMNLALRDVCNGDMRRRLRIDVYDWDENGKHDLIGGFDATLEQISTNFQNKVPFDCINPKKTSSKSYRNSGQVMVKFFGIEKK